MGIYERVEAVLAEIFGGNYYVDFPDFGEGQEPEAYAVYDLREWTVNYVADVPQNKRLWVTVSVFSPRVCPELYRRVEAGLLAAGFVYQGDEGLHTDTLYPHKKRKIMDFIIDIEIE